MEVQSIGLPAMPPNSGAWRRSGARLSNLPLETLSGIECDARI
jgi:hypothetical protein